ncbi:MAG: hypothetical protein ABI615_06015 [Chthoniobacterales bacterium]
MPNEETINIGDSDAAFGKWIVAGMAVLFAGYLASFLFPVSAPVEIVKETVVQTEAPAASP